MSSPHRADIARPDFPASVDAQRGDLRDREADDRDHVSALHDSAADRRDRLALARDADATKGADGDPATATARQDAARDRRAAANDRSHADADRRASWSDRSASAGERVVLSFDGLTGVYRRDTGLVELEREIARTRRTGQPLTVAFVDVDGLKVHNDRDGHAAGDRVLVAVADALRAHLRPYDPVVRLGGDEFVCAVVDLSEAETQQRFGEVAADLADASVAVTVGITTLGPTDTLQSVITRADEAMYAQREH